MSTSPPGTTLRARATIPESAPTRTVGTPKSPRRSLIELVTAVVVLGALAVAAGQVDLLVVIACLVVIVMVHELGHFLAAKHGRMKVTEYFLGFGPRLWSFRRGRRSTGSRPSPSGGT